MRDEENIAEKIQDARDILDRIIGFISNCDVKASIVLGILGIILTIFFTGPGLGLLQELLLISYTFLSFINIVYLLGLASSFIAFVFGVCKLLSVLHAKIEPSGSDSKIYFCDIASNSCYEHYKVKFLRSDNTDQLNDLLSQVFVNARICKCKFRAYNYGLFFSICGSSLFLVLLVLGYFVK